MSVSIQLNELLKPVQKARDALRDTFAIITSEQKKWNSHARDNLYATLNTLISAGLRGYTVEFDETLTNRQSIALVMDDQRTGIFRPADEKPQHYSYTGARLVFSQLTNGHIDVTVQYAGIPNLTLQNPSEQLKIVRCDELTDEAICGFVAEFINKVNEAIRFGL